MPAEELQEIQAASGAEEVQQLVGRAPKEETSLEYQGVSLALPQDQKDRPQLLLFVVLGEAVSCSPNAVGICFSTT